MASVTNTSWPSTGGSGEMSLEPYAAMNSGVPTNKSDKTMRRAMFFFKSSRDHFRRGISLASTRQILARLYRQVTSAHANKTWTPSGELPHVMANVEPLMTTLVS